MRITILPILLALAACATGSGVEQPPNVQAIKAAIVANKQSMWKGADSIKHASMQAPTRTQTELKPAWIVCLRLNAKNSFGGYSGEKPALVTVYDDGSKPHLFELNPLDKIEDQLALKMRCGDQPYEPFPELNGDYRPPNPRPPPPNARAELTSVARRAGGEDHFSLR